jgi:hypothetical protein
MNMEKPSPKLRSNNASRFLLVSIVLILIAAVSAFLIVRNAFGSNSSFSGSSTAADATTVTISTSSVNLTSDSGTAVPVSQASSPCPPDWYDSPDADLLDRCAREKGTATAKQEESARQTAEALATAQPSAPAPIPSTGPYASPPPRPTLPEPQNAGAIHPLDWAVDVQGDHIMQCMLRGYTSAWLDGFVPNAEYTSWDRLFVISRPGNGEHMLACVAGENADTVVQTNPTIETIVRDTAGSEKKYLHTWTSPRAVKTLYITSIVSSGRPGLGADGSRFEGLNSIVYFKTETGESGSFDMATQTWHFAP